MSWVTLTEAKFLAQCTGAETNALKSAALAAGQTEPLTETLANIVQQVRGYVAANSANRLGDGVTVPQELLSAAVAMARYVALNRLPVKSLLTDTRITEYKDALTLLRDVAAGRFRIEQPTTISSQVIGGPAVTLVSNSTRKATRATLAAL